MSPNFILGTVWVATATIPSDLAKDRGNSRVVYCWFEIYWLLLALRVVLFFEVVRLIVRVKGLDLSAFLFLYQ
jgi:hypothetical protein